MYVCAQAPLLAHAMLHHLSTWPSQDKALGLLVSLRKYYQSVWVRPYVNCRGTWSRDGWLAALRPYVMFM